MRTKSGVETEEAAFTVRQLIQQQMDTQSKRVQQAEDEDESKYAFKFPNIFDVFRSLF